MNHEEKVTKIICSIKNIINSNEEFSNEEFPLAAWIDAFNFFLCEFYLLAKKEDDFIFALIEANKELYIKVKEDTISNDH